MRFFSFALFISLILPASPLPAQQADSLQKEIERSAEALEKTSGDFQRLKDSLEKTGLRRSINHNSQPVDVFLQEMKERERKRNQQVYIRIGLVAVFLIVLATGLVRRRKMRNKS